jgi:cysteine desulfurase / selenocysteine lyase
MSTNTTNTSNGNGTSNGASRPKSSRKKSGDVTGEGARYYPFGAIPLPDPATLERLANEFFLSMPRDLGNGDDPGNGSGGPHSAEFETAELESDEIPVTTFPEGVPLREGSRVEGSPSVPGSAPSTTIGPLTETDLRAIAASLAGATAFVPGAPGAAPTPPAPDSPPEFLAERKTSPFADSPTLPPRIELFSFPGVSAAPASSPTSAPAGIDVGIAPASAATATAFPGSTPYFVEGGKGTSPGATPVLPPVNDLFSFPRVPSLPDLTGIQTTPNPPAPPASPSASPPTAADGTVVPSQTHDVKAVTPQVPTSAVTNPGVPTAQAQPSPPNYAETEKNAYPAAAASAPSVSELFSFPGVPGVQSAPAIPGLPSVSILPGRDTDPPSAASRQATAPSTAPSAFEFQPDLAPAELPTGKRPLDANLIRRDFPILGERVHGRPLIWLDNAATTQKPNAVIERIRDFYHHENSNIHRAAHELAARATDAYESAREKTRRFLNASSTREIIFVRGATEGINLVAQAWGRRNVREGDEIVITWLEHHANIVPWQMLCSQQGAKLRVAPVNDRGEIILEEYEKLLGPRTRIVAFSQVSNALGTITPAREMIDIAHRYGARALIDGAQSVSHMPVDMQSLGCDFFVFSGHKVFAPTGIGVVFGKLDVLDSMPPWQGGGNMIADVTFEKTTYQAAPARFEAGTGNIADAVGLGAALDYVDEIGRENIAAYEHDLLQYGTQKLLTVPGLRLIGTAREKAGVMSFVLDEVRSEDVGVALNQEGIAVRSGHHCAQPILRRMGVESTVRPSLAFYNTCGEIDALVATLLHLQAGPGHRKL